MGRYFAIMAKSEKETAQSKVIRVAIFEIFDSSYSKFLARGEVQDNRRAVHGEAPKLPHR